MVRSDGEAREDDLVPALDLLVHRGPDGGGLWTDGRCALGHRRLSILDLSDRGCQPMPNEEGTLWLTFNGEIYNFRELRSELQAAGHRFRSQTDSEVILHGFEQWGRGCLARLRGMFAFALWDSSAKSLLLARDRLGKKPLYYQRTSAGFLFSSEIWSLVHLPGAGREPALDEIDQYLTWGYVPAPGTGFRDIRKLAPGCWMNVQRREGGLQVEEGAYWSLPQAGAATDDLSEAPRRVRQLLEESVRLRLESDVPVGCFLSGGIDSTIVAGLMSRLSGQRVRTFSIGFEESEFNELEFAREAARFHGTDHQEFVVNADAADLAPDLARHYGEPFADDSAVPTWYLCRETAAEVKVALAGDGGDEAFGGYRRYRALQLASRLARCPGGALAARIASGLPLSGEVRRFFFGAARPPAEAYRVWIGATVGGSTDDEKEQLYGPELTASRRDQTEWMRRLFEEADTASLPLAAMHADLRSYLPYDLLAKVDVASMAHGLEVRSPLLDQELVELAVGLPLQCKLGAAGQKQVLRDACADLLPPGIARRAKMGFGMPVSAWLRGPLQPLLREVLESRNGFAQLYLRADEVKRITQEHSAGRADHGLRLWSLLMLGLWWSRVAVAPLESSPAVVRRPDVVSDSGG